MNFFVTEHSKHNQSDISQSHQQQPTADEEVLENREHKGDVDPLPHQEEKNGLDNPVLQQEEMEQDQEVSSCLLFNPVEIVRRVCREC